MGRVDDLELGPSSSSASGNSAPPGTDLTQFFQDFTDIDASITEIRKNLLMVQEKMDDDLDDICVLAGELRRKLEALDRSNAANRRIENCQAGSSTDLTRMAASSVLRTRLKELTVEFKALGQRFRDGFRDRADSLFFTATGRRVRESMMEHLIETGDAEHIFENAILVRLRGEVRDTITEIQERHPALKDMEKKLLELDQIFLGMGIVEEAQGDVPDNIEPKVDPAADNEFDRYFKRLFIPIVVFIVVTVMLVITLLKMYAK